MFHEILNSKFQCFLALIRKDHCTILSVSPSFPASCCRLEICNNKNFIRIRIRSRIRFQFLIAWSFGSYKKCKVIITVRFPLFQFYFEKYATGLWRKILHVHCRLRQLQFPCSSNKVRIRILRNLVRSSDPKPAHSGNNHCFDLETFKSLIRNVFTFYLNLN